MCAAASNNPRYTSPAGSSTMEAVLSIHVSGGVRSLAAAAEDWTPSHEIVSQMLVPLGWEARPQRNGLRGKGNPRQTHQQRGRTLRASPPRLAGARRAFAAPSRHIPCCERTGETPSCAVLTPSVEKPLNLHVHPPDSVGFVPV